MKIQNKFFVFLFLILLVGVVFYSTNNKKETLQIDIGYQSVTSQTWGALIIKNKNIFEDKLKERFKDKDVKVVWHDEISGAVINTNMISGKVQFGFMGDMPLILNMYKAENVDDYDSAFLAIDGTGINGTNQSILIPKSSKVKSMEDLKGKTISTPIGSSAHYMLMKALEKYDMLDDVTIAHQDVALASQLLSTNKTDAFSIWAPYPNFLVDNGSAKVLLDGKDTEIDYLAGVIVNNNWAKKNQDIVKLFIESLDEAHDFINNNQEEAAEIFAEESGFDLNITKKEVKNIKWNSEITEKTIEILEDKQKFLIDLEQIGEFDMKKHIYVEE